MRTSLDDLERLLRYGMCPDHRLEQQPCTTCQHSLDAIEDVRELYACAGLTKHAAGRDQVGKIIDVCDALLDLVERRAADYGETTGFVLHMTVMTWIDRMADRGVIRLKQMRRLIDGITLGMGQIERASGADLSRPRAE